MTVQELIDKLKQFPPDTELLFSDDSYHRFVYAEIIEEIGPEVILWGDDE